MAAEKESIREKVDGTENVAHHRLHLPWPVLAVSLTLMTLILIAGYLYIPREWMMFALVPAVFLLVVSSTAYFWRWQQVKQLRRQFEADTALRQSEERYHQLVDNLGEGISIADKDENFVFANPAAAEIFGVAPATLTGRNLKEFLPADELPRVEEQSRNRRRGEKGVYELRIRRSDGAECMLLVTAMPLTDSRGEISGTFGIFRDISDRKRDEEKIRKMLAEKELLLKEVHHRVKNNLMVIGSLLQIQAQRVGSGAAAEILLDSQNRISSMISIYEKLYRTTDLSHIDLKEYFSELTRFLFDTYNVRPGTINLETAISDIALDIDRTIPCGLIINELVSNALKYAFPGEKKGRIRIELHEIDTNGRGTARPAPVYALTVANDGVPLPAGFDMAKSSNFGLQLVNMLVGQLGGSLQINSKTGTEFRITFPKNHLK